ncbi:hypothetical protein FHS57_002177 [Runella defluvii]|uniref:Uncharacterized protein n=1 Tax=Runella defluvii TaxID=370973 RepID=A0A7W6EQ93_9BACT|nr:hypothetical protein [Runella defluvii]
MGELIYLCFKKYLMQYPFTNIAALELTVTDTICCKQHYEV